LEPLYGEKYSDDNLDANCTVCASGNAVVGLHAMTTQNTIRATLAALLMMFIGWAVVVGAFV
jgi:hypothetical protein